MSSDYCSHCGCPVDQHGQDNCQCDDTNTPHIKPAFNATHPTEDDPFCICERSWEELWQHAGWIVKEK